MWTRIVCSPWLSLGLVSRRRRRPARVSDPARRDHRRLRPGGGADVAARLVAGHASKKWGQPVNVVNMPGASGITGALRALNARPDGYTLLLDPHATARCCSRSRATCRSRWTARRR